ncbi:SBBP repeat-containing protein [Pseudobdellovibrio exovorus]|nr:SBBP repeat-containing protein [Pseudobdellovibrio exovorus]
MAKKLRIVSTVALVFVLIASFQNCSSYKADEGMENQSSIGGSGASQSSSDGQQLVGAPIVRLPEIDPVSGDIIGFPSTPNSSTTTTTTSQIPKTSFIYKTTLVNSSGQYVDAVCNASAVDQEGNSYCAGHTSSDLAEPNAGGADVFAMKIDSTGKLVWIRQLGSRSLVALTTDYTSASSAGDRAVVNHNDFANSIAVDNFGNVYVGGMMSPTQHKSGNRVSGYSGGLVGGGAFVMKLNHQGAIQWLKYANDNVNAVATNCSGLATDSGGNVYCTGSAVDFVEKSGNKGKGDVFVVKFNALGTIQWKRQLGSVSNTFGDSKASSVPTSITVDNAGNVYTAGVTDGNLAETSGGNVDAFVMKLSPLGVIQWVRQLGSKSNTFGSSAGADYCNGIAADSIGNVYCAGRTDGRLADAYAGGNGDAFVMKLNSQGTIQWVKQLGQSFTQGDSSQYEICYGVAVDPSNNVYCAGMTTSRLAPGSSANRNGDAFVTKLNPQGAVQWVKQWGETEAEAQNRCHGVSVDVAGNVYCAGYSNIIHTSGSSGFIMKIGVSQQ